MSDTPESGAGAPILVVDDEKNIRRTLRMVLEGEGYVVHDAGSQREAETILSAHTVDVIATSAKTSVVLRWRSTQRQTGS